MPTSLLEASIRGLKGLGAATAKNLAALGIVTIKDLVEYYPYRYEDYRLSKSIHQLRANEQVTIKAEVSSIATRKSLKNRRLSLTEAVLSDETGSITAMWFNQPFLAKTLKRGVTYYFSGQTSYRGKLQLQSPQYELAGETNTSTARIVPIYSLPDNIGPKRFRTLIQAILDLTPDDYEILPEDIRERHDLMSLVEAWRQIHFPETPGALVEAKRRLSFDEMLLLQLEVLRRREVYQSADAPIIPFNQESVKKFVQSLPYQLTLSQRKSAWEIIQDLGQVKPMNRLLQGDVGSGKTVVAGIAALNAALANFQTAILAPTEILAQQHYATLQKLFASHNIEIGLLTASVKPKEREELYRKIKDGTIAILIGTHAIFNEKVSFKDLGFVVIDEQHRFGVKQRAFLRQQGKNTVPHLLSMTATPIPRTLALTFYGDLAVSSITELPPNRKRPVTQIVSPKERSKAYNAITREILADRQCFVICPLVEGSDILEVKSATAEQKRLATEVFPEFSVGLIHGRLRSEEKEAAMKTFKEGGYHILVSTSVIEVGIDVPNASIIVIEGAERFGLAQLHQLRGRVSRSNHTPYCILIPSSDTIPERLEAITKNYNGFALAELDLKFRGMGELIGTRQSGFLETKIADPTNLDLVKEARAEAERVLEAGLNKYPELANLLEAKINLVHPE